MVSFRATDVPLIKNMLYQLVSTDWLTSFIDHVKNGSIIRSQYKTAKKTTAGNVMGFTRHTAILNNKINAKALIKSKRKRLYPGRHQISLNICTEGSTG